MNKLLQSLIDQELNVLITGADQWYTWTPVCIDEEEGIVYFTDIVEEEEESSFWQIAIRLNCIVAVGKATGKIHHDIETFISLVNGEDNSDATDEGN